MPDLTFVGLSDDGASLILSTPDGTRYSLPIDERVRAATRGGRVIRVEGDTTPVTARDVQSRVRSGATPEEVAEYSGWPLERVQAFAAPVLQERSWVTEQAIACPAGRGEEDPTLGSLVTRRLAERGIDEDATRWDAWRREDGLWTVLLAYPAGKGDRVATWSFDLSAKILTSDDDEARWFTEDRLFADIRPKLVHPATDDDAPTGQRPPQSSNHPAGRAAKRPLAAPAAPQPQPKPPQAQPKPPAPEPPRWDEVLFGSPTEHS
ncbi:MAG: septation protein SepH [Candidatus Nanopelagicales bacterium]|nr:septation protein SepH [Candidatus Nanopelagicales bacterium]